ncbi:MAG: PAS domain S-box protein [Deltaproteobacteria bacterium]|nr:PAS domain S-box protein [Deltaproteobacteria bacterium]
MADNTHEWCAEGIDPQIENLENIHLERDLPWFTEHMGKGDVFQQADIAELPPEGRLEREHFEAQGILSLIVVPMVLGSRTIGFLGFDAVRAYRTWTEDDQAILRLVGEVFTNAIERKRAEGALRGSEEKYRRIFENIQDVYYESSLDGTILEISPSIDHLSNYKRKELLGRSVYEIYSDPKERDEFLKVISERGRVNDFEVFLTDKDGSKHPCSLIAILVRDEQGGPVKIVGSMRDISERKQNEKERKKLEDQLHRAQKMESLGLMAGGIAHDLNNILSGIVSYPELLLMDLPEDSPLRKPIMIMQEAGMRAVDVVADLLTIVRGVATGKNVLSLNTIVTEYLDAPEYQKLKKMYSFVSFKTELDPDLLNVSGSPTHIKKTLMNLIVNATEAIEGSGTVTISTRNRYLDEPLKGYEDVRQGEYAVLIISDEGTGISPEDLERIFEPFYTKKVMGRSGTGLGLAVVWNTVQDHNGYIDVKSGDTGTVFELYFPVTREDVATEKQGVPLEDYLGHGERILVVDDEERQREIACGMITKLGYTAETVSSGEEAVAYVTKHPVDLIVLDLVMPKGINGRETYEEIIKIRPGQKAIIASGYAKTDEVDTAQALGAGQYLKKPYTLEKLGVAVKEELKK